MHLYLAEKMHKLKVEPKYFFRLAHQWKFGKDADVGRDVLTYQVGGIIPQYVREYIEDIQRKEKDNALQTVSRAN